MIASRSAFGSHLPRILSMLYFMNFTEAGECLSADMVSLSITINEKFKKIQTPIDITMCFIPAVNSNQPLYY